MTASSASSQEWLSFYCKKGYRELLTEHVRKMMSFDPDSRLVRMGSKVSEDFLLGLKIAIAFHDSGKIPFSDEMNFEGFYRDESLVFTGHEFISYAIVEAALLPELDGLKPATAEAVKLSVLLHHHPQNPGNRFKSLREKAKKFYRKNGRPLLLRRSSLLGYLEKLRELNAFEPQTVQQMEDNIRSSIKGDVEVISIINSDFEIRISDLIRGVSPNIPNEVYGLFMPMLLALITMDYVSARERESCGSGSESKFSEVAYEFYKYYLLKA